MKYLNFFILLLTLPATFLHAQQSEKMKPRWVSETPEPGNPTYDFIVVKGLGSSPEAASQACLDKLIANEDLKTTVQAIVNRAQHSVQQQSIENGVLNEQISNTVTMDVTMNGKQVNITVNPVDEYWEYISINGNRICECYALYMVAVSAFPPVYDNIRLTRHYGVSGLLRSIIPGMGQIYKGSMAKGIGIMSGEALCIAGIILCESTRASYIRKMKEQPKHANTYNTKAANWETGRNICIGAAAALYIYNLIDAAVAEGAKRVVVTPHRPIRFSVVPTVVDNGVGIGLALNF